MKMTNAVGSCLKRKTMLVWVGVHNKNFETSKGLCNLQELYTGFKEKQPNVNIAFSKFCKLSPKWSVLAGSKTTHSVCVCSTHQNVTCLSISLCDLYIQLILVGRNGLFSWCRCSWCY